MPLLTETYIFEEECKNIISACFSVHNELGKGFLEPIYQEALSIEFQMREIPFVKEEKLEIYYKNRKLQKYYCADFICYNEIILELKALDSIDSNHISQMLNYLKATKLELGLIINFGGSKVQIKRIIK